MSCPRPLIRLSPFTSPLTRRNPRILLGGSHQPTLLRYLEGWPKRNGKPAAFLIQFIDQNESLSDFPNDRFDIAVVQAPSADQAEVFIKHLVRVARQGLITRG
ncbi:MULTISPECIES: class I SAM-dependent methyltransferase [unclassified Pseudomonas]|uniref:class I SAM-dependent methyltransferase n=1 Tax=unclassified Pseudomonas TaxID=196821 RepID=UPI002AC9E25F|nr:MULTISPECIES: class I SAM-dependent methyltransferase [unclassified Pseudomonas]MEB0039984.1 class I SAM-dependent methyltransferase [Pseudomonas sp. MH10]MEB0076381.1 class I SAM-dependent methyltransferase [Pseudomonas sp. MH10out]MEB0092726.1 class I SAM-dependent methyltransferase [Pseudomonas sp. CCI4.2]MEB0104618.1 class I SAM-dependent methyltransferase [Pseudomonas sp. CCI3.2]MEB0119508.1 class I SAM-dependent methyltransferase [Pseudomonas sp. CCI1.2]